MKEIILIGSGLVFLYLINLDNEEKKEPEPQEIKIEEPEIKIEEPEIIEIIAPEEGTQTLIVNNNELGYFQRLKNFFKNKKVVYVSAGILTAGLITLLIRWGYKINRNFKTTKYEYLKSLEEQTLESKKYNEAKENYISKFPTREQGKDEWEKYRNSDNLGMDFVNYLNETYEKDSANIYEFMKYNNNEETVKKFFPENYLEIINKGMYDVNDFYLFLQNKGLVK